MEMAPLETTSSGRRGRSGQSRIKVAETLERGTQAQVIIGGDPIQNGLMDARFLGCFLVKVQDTINAIAQALAGMESKTGRWQNDVLTANRIRVSTSPRNAGSLIFMIDPIVSSGELTLLEMDPLPSALDVLSNLFSVGCEAESLQELLSYARVRAHYHDLLRLMGDAGATLLYVTADSPLGVKVTPEGARVCCAWLKQLSEKVARRTIVGVLEGGNVRTGKFDLRIGSDTLSGRISEKASVAIRAFRFGDTVEAELEVTTVSSEDGGTDLKTTYQLMGIRAPGTDTLSLFSDADLAGI